MLNFNPATLLHLPFLWLGYWLLSWNDVNPLCFSPTLVKLLFATIERTKTTVPLVIEFFYVKFLLSFQTFTVRIFPTKQSFKWDLRAFGKKLVLHQSRSNIILQKLKMHYTFIDEDTIQFHLNWVSKLAKDLFVQRKFLKEFFFSYS